MTETLTVTPTNSKGLQAALDQVGTDQAYDALKLTSGAYSINKPLYMNSGTEFYGPKTATLQLISNAPRSLFKPLVPILGQKESTIKDIFVHGFCFDGLAGNQNVKWGDGYDNFLYFQDAENIKLRNLIIRNSQGDGARFRDSKNIEMWGCNIDRTGHDGLHARNCNNVNFHDNAVQLRTNSGCRTINTDEVLIYGNKFTGGSDWWAGGSGVQIDHSEEIPVSKVEVYNNEFYDTYGPGMWLSNSGEQSKDLSLCRDYLIHDNLLMGCGINPDIDWGAGILWSGVDNCSIYHNTIIDCFRHGIGANVGSSVWGTKPQGRGYICFAESNVIYSTKKSPFGSDKTNGYGIASTIFVTHSLNAEYNIVCGNEGGATINTGIDWGNTTEYVELSEDKYIDDGSEMGRRRIPNPPS